MHSLNHQFFDHAANVRGRLRFAERFPRREDIHGHAGTLIDLQDGRIGPRAIRLDLQERAAGRYIGRLIGHPAFPQDELAPVGIKLPPLYFSPLFHIESVLRSGTSISSAVPHLPRTVPELENWLNEEMEGVFGDSDRFEKTTGVTIHVIAQFLFAIRTTHSALFLLLLSFEIEEAGRMMPCLNAIGGQSMASEWRETYFSKAKCSILAIFEIVRILRRGTAIVNELSTRRRFTVGEVRNVAARLRKGITTSADRATLESVAISTYGLRKIVLNDIDRHHAVRHKPGHRAFRRRATDEHTLLSMIACVSGSDAAYAVDVLDDYIDNAVKNLPVAGLPPVKAPKQSAIKVARIPRAGKNQGEQLFTFYGLTGRELAILVAIEVGAVLGDTTSVRSMAALGSAILDTLWSGESEVRSDQVVTVGTMAHLIFPAAGEFRHSCGFARSSWADLEADAGRWRALAESESATDPGDSYAELFLATRRYLHGFSYGTARLQDLDAAARIFCHLSHAMGPLAQDPIWIRLLDRAKFIAGINAKNTPANNNRGAMFGPGPKSLDRLIRSIG